MAGDDWTAVIIEDDPDVRDLIDIVLTQSGFSTVVVGDGHSGVEAVRAHNPLITTLDVNMPGMDGFAAAKRLREFSNTYLIFITSLGDEIDVVQGFEAGADDYLVKPFRPRELRARADSMLRRPRTRHEWPMGHEPAPAPPPAPVAPQAESWAAKAARELTANAPRLRQASTAPAETPVVAPAPSAAPPAPVQPPAPVSAPAHQAPSTPAVASGGEATSDGPLVRFKTLTLNNETRMVTLNGGAVDLTRAEFDLLASLMSTGRRVRSKADLVLAMRGQQYVTSYFVNEADKRSVETNVTNLRRKLGDESTVPRFIETVRGVGYRLAEV
ncbi:response regulator transcription factor [Nocardioides sp. cx-173]|uniref:response regulator transcription factor n=1 Tax=Nocardioides sp. cx-173 TaxID=2898796 RepID=UPI0022AC7A52|nr:response regulator transcription factor [Nocardioides sp. cx-173]